MNYKSYTNKAYLYGKDTYEAKHQLLINKREGVGPEKLNDSKVFVVYSDDKNEIYEIID